MRWFWWIVAFVGVQRLIELVVSRRNLSRLLDRGGRLIEGDGHRAIVAVHVAWFLAMGAEHVLASWSGWHAATVPLLGGFVLAEGLRLWAIGTLGERWTTRVVVVDEPPVEAGPYRWLAHPNYVAVWIELVVLPLAFGLWITAAGIAVAKTLALVRRIRREEAAWARLTRDGA
jgi:methyltransferase